MKNVFAVIAMSLLSCCTGPMGPAGPKGDMGDPGVAGKDGKDGRDGDALDFIEAFTEQIAPYEPSIFNVLCAHPVQQEDGTTVNEWVRGTGTKISDTRVLTAAHVTADATSCQLYFLNKTFAAAQKPKLRQTIVNGRVQDLVIIEDVAWTQLGEDLEPVPWSDDYHVHEGELVGMISYPESFDKFLVYTFGRVNVASFPSSSQAQDAIVVDLVSWHGSSGAPVFNQAGIIIGILISGYDTKNYDLQFVNALRNVNAL